MGNGRWVGILGVLSLSLKLGEDGVDRAIAAGARTRTRTRTRTARTSATVAGHGEVVKVWPAPR